MSALPKHKSARAREADLNAEAAYAGSYRRFASSVEALGLSDKQIAQRAGISHNTPGSWRQRQKLPDLPTLFKLRAWLGESWWQYVLGSPADWAPEQEYDARLVALEARLHELRQETRG